VTGQGLVDGRPGAGRRQRPTVKAGSWGARTVEKIIRITERALAEELPIFWLIDSAGARITDQVALFPGRRGAGRIFHNQVALSGKVPDLLPVGRPPPGGAYIPSFCDIVIMVEGNASMYLGSPRMAEMVVGEKVTLEEMGGARMHATVSGWRRQPGRRRRGRDRAGQAVLLLPADVLARAAARRLAVAAGHRLGRRRGSGRGAGALRHARRHRRTDRRRLVLRGQAALRRRADHRVGPHRRTSGRGCREQLSGARRGAVRRLGRQGGAVHLLCDAFNVPLLYLADVPGFMIGSEVERQGIIRHGAKMITAVAEATVPQISVIARKAYGAGLYAMAGRASCRTPVSRCPRRRSR